MFCRGSLSDIDCEGPKVKSLEVVGEDVHLTKLIVGSKSLTRGKWLHLNLSTPSNPKVKSSNSTTLLVHVKFSRLESDATCPSLSILQCMHHILHLKKPHQSESTKPDIAIEYGLHAISVILFGEDLVCTKISLNPQHGYCWVVGDIQCKG